MFLATHWPDIDRWAPARWKLPDIDKVVHAGMYGGWVVTWWWLLASRKVMIGRAAVAWMLVGGAIYAAFDEISQGWVDRDPDVADWAFDVLGMIVAVLILRTLIRRRAARTLR
jgi:VanZ family protein